MKVTPKTPWRRLFAPQKYCKYVNDHTIFQDKTGNFRLLGTCADTYSVNSESFFVVGTGSDLSTKFTESEPLFKGRFKLGPKIAPYCFFDPKLKKYHLFFGPMIIRHYVSNDGINWSKTADAVKSFWPPLRDPHVIYDKGKYLMYLTDFGNKISVFVSYDLTSWKKLGTAFSVTKEFPKSFNSACESSCVVSVKYGYMLFTTIVPARFHKTLNYKNYNNTQVFFSENPLVFEEKVGSVEAHAPEVLQIKGRYFLTTCGWIGFPKPRGVNGEGVFIRELVIEN